MSDNFVSKENFEHIYRFIASNYSKKTDIAEVLWLGDEVPSESRYSFWLDNTNTLRAKKTKNGTVTWVEISGNASGGSASAVALEAISDYEQNISADDECNIEFTWSTTAGETSKGNVYVYVNSSLKLRKECEQGNVSIPIHDYLITGKTNTIKIVIRDIYGTENSLEFSVAVISITVSSSFKQNTILNLATYPTSYSFPIVVKGGLNKTVHIILDGTELTENSITVSATESGVQKYVTIPSCHHGIHSLELYATALLNGKTLTSNKLYYELVWIEEGQTDVLIASQFTTKEADQYEVLTIPYFVYDPTTEKANVYFEVNGERENENALSVNRTQQMWETSGSLVGENTFNIICGNATKTFKVNLLEVETVDVEDVKDELQVCFVADKIHNNTIVETRDVWQSTGVYPNLQAQFNNFNWKTDGWTTVNGSPALNISGGASLDISYPIFAGSYKTEDGNTVDTDFKTVGGTVEIEFKVSEVTNIDTPFLTCMSNGRGIEITPQRAMLKSAGTEVVTQFKEGNKNTKDDKIRISFVVNPLPLDKNQSIVYIYINGIASGAITYESTDSFKQEINPVGIAISSQDCAVDLFSFRVYRSALTAGQIRNNWIYDMSNIGEQVNAYKRNDIYDLTSGEILYSKLLKHIPCMTITGATPTYKGDKKIVNIQFEGTEDGLYDFILNNAQIDVQGTSSQYYPLKNWKFKSEYKIKNAYGNEVKVKQKFMTNGGESATYSLGEGLLGDKVFCLKADYMESSSTHNTVTANIANDMYSVQTPAQSADKTGMTRTTIYGRPIVVFYKETEDSERVFGGKFNFNYDKDAEGVFGFVEDDNYEVIECFEFCNNTSDRCLLHKSEYINKITPDNADDYEDYLDANGQIPEWRTDFETRFCYRPEANTKPDYAYLKAVTDWLVSVDQTQATGKPLSEPYATDSGVATYLYDENANIITFIDGNGFTRKAIDIGLGDIQYSYEAHQVTETDGDGNETIVEYYALPIDEKGIEVYRFTHDTATYRLSKFKTEIEEHFNVHFVLMYYLLTDVLGMIDSRTKNMFWATWGERHKNHLDNATDNNVIWYPIFYDMDTMLGLSNAGKMDIPYNVEYDTKLENSDVGYAYNGASNVLWNNVEDAFATELKALYKEKCSDGVFTYKAFLDAYEGHSDNWCESIYNEDAQRKQVLPFTEGYFGYTEDSTDEMVTTYPDYLYVVQGNRKYHRRWWLDNRFNYVNSKYGVNSYMADYITMRLYTPENVAVEPNADFTITTYSDQYVRIKYGSKTNYEICTHNVPTVIKAPDDTFNDTETIIYGASRIISVGDLSDKYARSIDLSKASKLTEAIIGSDVEGYSNSTLDSINVTSNPMLQKVYVQNCPNLSGTLNIANCPIIKEVLAHGTNISMLAIPEGGILEKVTLPNSMLNLNIIDHANLNDFSLAKNNEGKYNLEVIRIEDTPIDDFDLVQNSPNLTRLRLLGIDWHIDDETVLYRIKNTIKGVDANGNDQDKPVLMGDCEVLNIKDYLKDDIDSYFNGGVPVENLPELSKRDFRLTAKNVVTTHLVRFFDSVNATPMYSGITDNRVITKSFAHYKGTTPVKAEDWAKTYEFSSWGIYVDGELKPIENIEAYPITEDTDFYAIYAETEKIFTINFYRQNADTGYYDVYKTEKITYDDIVVADTFPDEFAHYDYALRFKGWNTTTGTNEAEVIGGGIIAVTENSPYVQDFYAVYTLDYKYRITFVDYNDTVIKNTEIYYTGDNVVVPIGITRNPDIQYVYTFAGWSLDGKNIIEIPEVDGKTYNITYKAVYSYELRPYTIIFKDWDNTVLSEQIVRYSEMPIIPTPSRIGYTFAGWDSQVTTVIGNTEYIAQYNINYYNIKFVDYDGSVLSEQSIAYLNMPTIPTPLRTGYTFVDWDSEIVSAFGDATYTAQYTINYYEIIFVNWDGTILSKQSIAYLDTPTIPENPSREETAQYFYDFDGWDKEVVAVTGDTTYMATYLATIRTYTVKWVNEDGSSLLEEDVNVPYGEMPSYDGATPTKQGNAQYTYSFAGWHIDISTVTGHITYIATYTATVNTYTVTWKNADGTVIETDVKVPYGDMPEYNGSTPTKASNAQYDFIFAGWDTAVSEVTGDVVYTATYTEHIRSYTIKFVDYNGTVLSTQSVEFGTMPSYNGATPAREGHDFTGWSPAFVAVVDEATYTAQYKIKTYTVTWKVGNETKTTTCEHGSTPTPPSGFEVGATVVDGSSSYTVKAWNVSAITGDTTYIAVKSVTGAKVSARFTKICHTSQPWTDFLNGTGYLGYNKSSSAYQILYGLDFETLRGLKNLEITDIKVEGSVVLGSGTNGTSIRTAFIKFCYGFDTSSTSMPQSSNYTDIGDGQITLMSQKKAGTYNYNFTGVNLPNTLNWIKNNVQAFLNGYTSNSFGAYLKTDYHTQVAPITVTITCNYDE